MRRRYAAAAIGLASAASLGACSLILPLQDSQCASDGDCRTRGAAFGSSVCIDRVCQPSTASAQDSDVPDTTPPDAGVDSASDRFRCLNEPTQNIDPSKLIHLQTHSFDALKQAVTGGTNGGSDLDLISATPLVGVSIRACDVFDPSCSSPLTDPVLSDEAGVAQFDVHGDFSGYFELNRPDLFPTVVFPGRVYNPGPETQSITFPILTIFATKEIAQTLGVPLNTDPDAGLGHGFFVFYDCDDRQGAGVSFSFGDAGADGSTFFYQRGQFPDPSATSTDHYGVGGVINYPAGFAVLTATESATGRVLGSATTLIRPAQTTFTWIRMRVRQN